ncbi:winged helix-turn-helix domain-containing protein [Streptomyces sp. NPDC006798]|uniref:ArsR/SmtB family transcription factor n=1 Tax=Streptomyces sp. NPDC006798 TaxID=3155462 RepID=UPI0033EA8CC3
MSSDAQYEYEYESSGSDSTGPESAGPGSPAKGAPATGSESPARDYRPLDPRSLRGLAHPLRIRLLTSLRHDGPATASQLAERLGESSGATSYHLRQLAAHGFVSDDPARGKGRERWWQAATTGTSIDQSLFTDPDPAVRGAADLFIHEIGRLHGEEVATWLGTAHEWPAAWRRASDLSDFTLRLTPERARELRDRVHELIESYHDPAAEPVPGEEPVRMHLHLLPRSAPGTAPDPDPGTGSTREEER